MLQPDEIRKVRSYFPHTAQGKIYLNHAGTGPLSVRVVDAMSAYLRERSAGKLDTYSSDLLMVAECRSMVARLVNADSPDRIAFLANTSDALNVIAAGMDWKSGDRLIVPDIEFPANVYPYLNLKPLGVEVDVIACPDGCVTPDMVADAMSPRTRLVALSAVQFLSGHRSDLRQIGSLCRDKGVVFAVDAIQAVGAVDIDVRAMKIDALAAGAQKWQMAPHGTGFLYVTGELQERLHQKHLGWLSVENPWDFHNYAQPLAPSARRYEGGSLNMPGLWGYHAALSTLTEIQPARLESHLLDVTRHLIDGLGLIPGVSIITPRADADRAGIVTVSLPRGIDEQAVFSALLQRRITAAVREGKLRYSPHFYNTPDEMTITVHATEECLKKLS